MPSAPAKTENAGRGARLDSWKEIAAYLGKAERTVKRWEKERGLPAHRLPGSGNASVYAYTVELEQWLKSGTAPEPEASPECDADPRQDQLPSPATRETEPNAKAAPIYPKPEALLPPAGFRRRWLLAFCGLLLAGIAGAAVNSPIVRASSERLARLLPDALATTHRESDQHASTPVSDFEKSQAHDLYLKGRYEWTQRTPDSLNRALDDFTQAIVHDPGNAQAYVGLADTYDLMREFSTMPESDAYTRSIAAARKAIELDDSLADAHRALAFAEWWGKWDFADGEKEFRRAIKLNPNDPIARNWYANALLIRDRFSEALEENAKARDLDPSSHSILADRGNILFYAGKRDEGIAMLKDVEAASPNFGSPHSYLMEISFEMRDYPAFLAEGKKAAETRNDSVLGDIVASAQTGYAQHGEGGLLNNLYTRQKEYYLAGKYSGAALAVTCVMMGKKQEGLQLLEEGYDRRDMFVLASGTNPVLFTLRDDPRYEVLLAKLDFHPTPGRPSPNAPAKSYVSQLRAPSDPR
jgi:tetratricopeptide (TPR) repeat protein